MHIQANTQNPMEKQAFCRRDPVNAQRVRTEVPRMKRDGTGPVMGRDNKPIMENGEAWAFLYRPTLASLTCFDGWRPLGTLPGDKWQNAIVDQLMKQGIAAIQAGLNLTNTAPGSFDREFMPFYDMCPHDKPAGLPCPECPDGVATVIKVSG